MPGEFNRDSMAQWYARQHVKTDPGIEEVFYLHHDAPEREIRFVEVNTLLCEPNNDPLEPIDFGVDTGMESAHKLMVLDVTPQQWEQIQHDPSRLPSGWSMQNMRRFTVNSR
jgi:hypothetical protein